MTRRPQPVPASLGAPQLVRSAPPGGWQWRGRRRRAMHSHCRAGLRSDLLVAQICRDDPDDVRPVREAREFHRGPKRWPRVGPVQVEMDVGDLPRRLELPLYHHAGTYGVPILRRHERDRSLLRPADLL